MIRMNPITLPIIITIAVIGIIAIILVKLFYKDPEVSDLSDELPSIISKHWEEPINDDIVETEDSNEHGFVTKSWEEPMSKKKELNNGIASKVFQEPMHTKHQDIMSKEYEKQENVSYIQTENVGMNDNINENKQSNLDNFENEEYDNQDNLEDIESFQYFDFDDYNYDYNPKNNDDNELNNTNFNDNSRNNNIDNIDNMDLRENNDSNFRITKSEDSNYQQNDYETKNEYYSSNYDKYENINKNDEEYFNSYQINENEYNSDITSENYNSYEKEPLEHQEVFAMGEQVVIGGKSYNLKVGDDIIFNYNGESYSSRILEIKHENIRVKYRAQEKWISFSDIKKVF
ncbi:hypothetical protein ALNOE001_02150 [Candidatus Methanobinarius endosymbioticus]|uniref:Uncharacterized protein n=1 Tax=Candidatus Methanobinarius endosymbioticus TaxID=2006182 RepID=A0A366MFS3_9EURY|nr:hypothetical protein ALNOE001_02150 [Candidatus Methanobinarius endosymbioticus]